MTTEKQSSLLGKIAAYTEILIKDPNSTIFVSLAETYRKMGLFSDALQILHKGMEKYPDLPSAHIVLGRIQCQQGGYAEATTSFDKALAFDPDNLAALVGSARVHILLERFEDARQVLMSARALSPADPVINKLILSLPEPEPEAAGEVERDEDETPEEESAGSLATPPTPLVSATIADLYLKQGLLEDALQIYGELAVRDPHNLDLRRKIKEIERRLAGDNAEEVADSSETAPVIAEELSDKADDNVEEPYAAEPDTVDPELPLSSEPVLSVLNRWLANIEKRRVHV